jgi:ribosomal protein S6
MTLHPRKNCDRLATHMEMNETVNDKRLKVYEIGYLFLPTIPEEQLPAEAAKVKAVVESHEGVVITEDFPKLRQLAYTMRKVAGAQNFKFDKAYFGWVKFETVQGAVPVIQKELEKNPNILRHMLVATVRENTMFTQKPMFRPATVAGVGEALKGEEKVKMSEEEIDKTIENLVVQ